MEVAIRSEPTVVPDIQSRTPQEGLHRVVGERCNAVHECWFNPEITVVGKEEGQARAEGGGNIQFPRIGNEKRWLVPIDDGSAIMGR